MELKGCWRQREREGRRRQEKGEAEGEVKGEGEAEGEGEIVLGMASCGRFLALTPWGDFFKSGSIESNCWILQRFSRVRRGAC